MRRHGARQPWRETQGWCEMSGSGLQKLSFALLMALMFYAAIGGGGS